MPAPINHLKLALAEGRPQIGLWLALASSHSAELLGQCGYDWLLIDGEHAPNDIPRMVEQLQALAGTPTHPAVRVPAAEVWMLKQVLDIGAQTVVVPMIESVAQAQAMVAAVRYPPRGVRGVGAALARASQFGLEADYIATADAQICLILQVESRAGIAVAAEIAALDGVDGVFIGPADLAADMGFPGNPAAPQVRAAIDDTIRAIVSAGKSAGILTGDQAMARHCLDLGATFVGIGNDVGVLRSAALALRRTLD
jgi:4-hydroxy-2-oxoheptanedioate aldolase